MVTISYAGRLGNNFFQYAAAYLFAKKFNLNLITQPIYNIFNLPLLQGNNFNNEIIDVDESNFLDLLNSEKIKNAHYRFCGYFQQKYFVLKFCNEIKSIFSLKYDNIDKDLVFVSYRIGDLINTNFVLPIDYYINALNSINFNGGYISSDTLNHPNVLELAKRFNLELYDNDANNTINFAKNFNNLVLSDGSFNFWIGFLSNAENILFCDRPKIWCGDIFVLPEWKGINFSN